MKNRKNKLLFFLSRGQRLHFILACSIVAMLGVLAYATKRLSLTDVFELGAFSAVVLEAVLAMAAEFLRNRIYNAVEDRTKLTTDYASLVKRYKSLENMICAYAGGEVLIEEKIPVVLDAWLYDCTVCVEDHPEWEYSLPDLVIKHYEDLFAAHYTSTIYNNSNIRVCDWGMEGDVFTIRTGRTTYYNGLVTNRCADFELQDGITVRNWYECGPMLHPLAYSALSNHLGFNGFVESSDGKICFVERSADVSIGKKTWGNSIGASLKVKYALDEKFNFSRTGMHRAMVAEIRDELGIEETSLLTVAGDDASKVVIISAYRDLVEAGKPQLLMYARSALSSEEIEKVFYLHNAASRDGTKHRGNGRAVSAREKKENKMLTDGTRLMWIAKTDFDQIQVHANRILYDGNTYPMVPSSAACVRMFQDYLKDEAAGFSYWRL